MRSDDANVLVLLVLLIVCGIYIWLVVLFVRLCRDVRSIKTILMTADGLKEFRGHRGLADGAIPEERPNRGPDFLS